MGVCGLRMNFVFDSFLRSFYGSLLFGGGIYLSLLFFEEKRGKGRLYSIAPYYHIPFLSLNYVSSPFERIPSPGEKKEGSPAIQRTNKPKPRPLTSPPINSEEGEKHPHSYQFPAQPLLYLSAHLNTNTASSQALCLLPTINDIVPQPPSQMFQSPPKKHPNAHKKNNPFHSRKQKRKMKKQEKRN